MFFLTAFIDQWGADWPNVNVTLLADLPTKEGGGQIS